MAKKNTGKKIKKVRGGMLSMASRLGQPLARSAVRAVRTAAPIFKPHHVIKQGELHIAKVRGIAAQAEREAAHVIPAHSRRNVTRNLKLLRNTMKITDKQIESGRLPQTSINRVLSEINKLINIYPKNTNLLRIKRHLERPVARAYRAKNEYQLRLFRAFEEALTEQNNYEILWIQTYHDSQYTVPKIVRSMYAYNTAQLKRVITINNDRPQDIEHCYEINRALTIDVNLGTPDQHTVEWIREKLNGPNNLLPIDQEIHPLKTQLLDYIKTHPGSDPREAFELLTPQNEQPRLEQYFREAHGKLLSLKTDFEGGITQHSEEHIRMHLEKINEDIRVFAIIFTPLPPRGGRINLQFGGVDKEISNKITDFIVDKYIEINADNTDLITINNNEILTDVFNKYKEITTALYTIKENSENAFEYDISSKLNNINQMAGGTRRRRRHSKKYRTRKH